MNYSIVLIGSELTTGRVLDINSSYLSSKLVAQGHVANKILLCSDDSKSIKNAFACVTGSDFVFVTGGLGPTKDDMTRKIAAEYVQQELLFNPDVFNKLKQFLLARGIKAAFNNRQQAYFPADSFIIPNSLGTADGFKLNHDSGWWYFFPGVPSEMKALFETVQDDFVSDEKTVSLEYLFSGTSESVIDAELEEIMDDTVYSLCARNGFYEFFADFKNLSLMAEKQSLINLKLKSYLVSNTTHNPLQVLLDKAIVKKIRLGTAESCTGGKVGALLSELAGSSQSFNGSIIAYQNFIKENILYVSREILETKGAVSKECVEAMALGASSVLKSDITLAISGIAGPSGGSEDKPVGTVWFGLQVGNRVSSYKMEFRGNREVIRNRATYHGIRLLLQAVDEIFT